MNQEIKSHWLAKLKSGEYTQGRTYLSGEGKHCCLGVLCEMAIEAGLPIEKKVNVKYGNIDAFTTGKEGRAETQTVWPLEVVKHWAGLPEDICGSLSGANDNYCNGKYTAVIPLIEEL